MGSLTTVPARKRQAFVPWGLSFDPGPARLARSTSGTARGLLAAARPLAKRLVSAEQTLLDVAQNVELPGLHLRLENFDDIPGEPEAGAELNQNLPDRLGVVADAKRRLESLLDELQIFGGDLHVQGLERLVFGERSSSHSHK